jgi:hypothetical protein
MENFAGLAIDRRIHVELPVLHPAYNQDFAKVISDGQFQNFLGLTNAR